MIVITTVPFLLLGTTWTNRPNTAVNHLLEIFCGLLTCVMSLPRHILPHVLENDMHIYLRGKNGGVHVK